MRYLLLFRIIWIFVGITWSFGAGSDAPTSLPSSSPSTFKPSSFPSSSPTTSPIPEPTSRPTPKPTPAPTKYPSSSPSSKPTFSPIAHPTTPPSSSPTDNPSSSPTGSPTTRPSFSPKAKPTTPPSAQPTDRPSRRPTDTPTTPPSSTPTENPTSRPSAQPFSSPSSFPSSGPSSAPTGNPSENPSSSPTVQPTSVPSSLPSSSPSTVPSTQPSSLPSAIPSTSPTHQPIPKPTGRPTERPIAKPTHQPTSTPSPPPTNQPSSQPTAVPTTSHPTKLPTSIPTAQPVVWPTAAPTDMPSGEPTSVPTLHPSLHPTVTPSADPTSHPTSNPTSQPTGSPSSRPTRVPSGQPTAWPSTQPTTMPSGQPTSQPSTFASPRYFECGPNLGCESNSLDSCSFFTGNIVLLCTPLDPICLFRVGTFNVGPNTHFNVSGNCSLVVLASSTITIEENSTVEAKSMNFTAVGSISIAGKLTSSGLGPTAGPGAPVVNGIGAGGSYGGSGGKNTCGNASFSVVDYQIGTVAMVSELTVPVTSNPTYGSGGGGLHGGRSGGRIILSSHSTITIGPNAKVLAEGGASKTLGYGAGSGGGIVILGVELYNYGYVSVQGGPSNLYGAAGGGGRIAVSITSGQSIYATNILSANIAGGMIGTEVNPVTQKSHCLQGGAGTIYYEYGSKGEVISYNEVHKTLAATPLSLVPSQTVRVNLTNLHLYGGSFALASGGSNCQVTSLSSYSASCSVITLSNTTLHCANQTIVFSYILNRQFTLKSCGLNANVVSLTRDSQVIVKAVNGYSGTGIAFSTDSTSTLSFGTYLSLNFTRILMVKTPITQFTDSAYAGSIQPTLRISTTAGNVSLHSITANKILVEGNYVNIASNARWMPLSIAVDVCAVDVNATQLTCNYPYETDYNSIRWMKAKKSLTIGEGVTMQAAMLFMCASTITFAGNVNLTADALGCKVNNGSGAGLPGTWTVSGGGGAGYGGNGGYGWNNPNSNGGTYTVAGLLSTGSGGGCATNTAAKCTTGSMGGGIISLYGLKQIVLNANLSASGQNGAQCSGGGSGGGISLVTNALTGKGSVKVNGGNGGSCGQPGGGGGGGYITLSAPSNNYDSYTFLGPIVAYGGAAGFTSVSQEASVETGVSILESSIQPYAIQGATSGVDGAISTPSCPAGEGNDPTTGQICYTCPTGTYSEGGSGDCIPCSNAPTHSSYTGTGGTTSNCPYECSSGYSTDKCLDPLNIFIFNTLTLGGLAGVCAGVFALIILPLLYYRYKRYHDYGDKKMMDASDFFSKVMHLDVIGFQGGEESNHGGKGSAKGLIYTENPLAMKSKGSPEDLEDAKIVAIRKLQPKRGLELRREHRMADSDMIFHACRVNLYGQNHPWLSQGGPWILSDKRPNCLKPTLKKKEYQELAQSINQAVAWQPYSGELIFFSIASFLMPPLAGLIMREYRKRRAAILMSIISNYDYSCFKCPEQRKTRNSIRIGISPDASLAYIDFLFDDEAYSKRAKPLCPLGQTKLPAAFRFAGLGTYYAPYYLDTNDLILQAIPQTDVVSDFIDSSWISFVVELNTVLRKLQDDALYEGIVSVIRFLSDPKNSANLGGLIIEFCTFNNVPVMEAVSEEELLDPLESKVITTGKGLELGKTDRLTAQNLKSIDIRRPSSFADDRGSVDERTRIFSVDKWLKGLGEALNRKPANSQPVDITSRLRTEALSTAGPSPAAGAVTGQSLSFRPDGSSIGLKKTESESRPSESMFQSWTRSFCFGLVWLFNCLTCGLLCHPKPSEDPEAIGNNDQLVKNGTVIRDAYRVDRLMSFPETLDAIRRGDALMGVVISHPKVLNDVYIAQEEDFESGDETEADFIADTTPFPSNYLSRDGNSSTRMRSVSDDTESVNNYPSKTISVDTTEDPLYRAYGNKAEEMLKFYRIMQQAEKAGDESETESVTNTPAQPVQYSPERRGVDPFDLAPTPATIAIPIEAEGDPLRIKMTSFDTMLSDPSSRDRSNSSMPPSMSSMSPTPTAKDKRKSLARGEIAALPITTNTDTYTEFAMEMSRPSIAEGLEDSRRSSARPISVDYVRFSQVDPNRISAISPFERMRTIGASTSGSNADLTPYKGNKKSEDRDEPDNEDYSTNNEGDELGLGRPISGMTAGPRSEILSTRTLKEFLSVDVVDGEIIPKEEGEEGISPMYASGLSPKETGGGGSISPLGRVSAMRNKSQTSQAPRSRKKQRKMKNNMPALNLAPGCLQQKIKPWRFTVNEYEPTTDGKLGPKFIRAQQKLDEEDEEEAEQAAAKAYLDIESGPDRTNPMLIKDDPGIMPRPSGESMGALSKGSSHYQPRLTDENIHHHDTARESIFPTFMQLSFAGISGSRNSIGSGKLERNKSAGGLNDGHSQVSAAGKSDRSDNRQSGKPSSHFSTVASEIWTNTFQRQLNYLYYNGFYLYYITKFFLGCNVYPYGPKWFRKIFEIVVFFLCISDLTLWVLILSNTSCASDDPTKCEDHTALALVILVWPGALLIAPLMGLTAILLGPSGDLARFYALWSRLAAINNTFMIAFTIKYWDYYSNLIGSIYFPMAVTSSRVFQCFLVDYYIAHIERLRYTRGWDGLNTSLFKTKDNKKEIGL